MPNWDVIRKEFESSKITLKVLAEKYDIKLGTLKSRKSREGWSRDPTEKDATKNKKVATIKKKVATVEPVIENDNLNDKQKMFCLYYIKYFNDTKAYQKAYHCSYEVANKNAYTLMVNHGIKQEIERLKVERQQGLFLDAQAVLQKYINIAFADITDFIEFGQKGQPEFNISNGEPLLDDDGEQVMYKYNFVNLRNDDVVDGTIVTEVKQGKDGVSIKLEDRKWALDKLAKYFDLFPDEFNRRIEEEKLKIAHHKVFGGDEKEEYEDDGFNEALDCVTHEVWDDEKD